MKIYVYSILLFACLMPMFTGFGRRAFAMGETPKAEIINVGGKQFLIPRNNKALYDENTKTIRFILDASTLKIPNKEDINPDAKRMIEVFVMEIENNSYGEQKFWPDPLKKWSAKECITQHINAEQYQWCSYGPIGKDVRVWGDQVYSILNAEGATTLVLGCNNNPSINPLCEGLGLMWGNIHLRYTYSADNFDNALQINQALRKIITEFHASAER